MVSNVNTDLKSRLSNFFKRRADEEKKLKKSKLVRESYLKEILPKYCYFFHSDYFEVGNEVAQILTIIMRNDVDRKKAPFWGVRLFPRGLGKNVKGRLISQLSTKDDNWIKDNMSEAEKAIQSEYKDFDPKNFDSDSVVAKIRDLKQIHADVKSGAYHGVEFKVLLKAPTLEELDRAREAYRISLNTFEGVHAEPFEGQQREDYQKLYTSPDTQLGAAFNKKMYTSQELAGSYYLVSKGVNDLTGEYVGLSTGDINNTAAIFDVDDWLDNVVVASDFAARTRSNFDKNVQKNARSATLWGKKIAEAALIENHRVVHIVLDGTDMESIGTDLSQITVKLELGRGAINPFQIFGRKDDQITSYPKATEKIRLMIQQISPSLSDTDLNDDLTDILKDFYIDKGLWKANAQENESILSLVGIPNDEYPLLRDFIKYLDVYYTKYVKEGNKQGIKSIRKLRGAFKKMREENGDIFNKITDNQVNIAHNMPQAIYDFSNMSGRGEGIAMAQLINTLSYATQSLERGDVLIIHGTESISDSVKDFVAGTLEKLRKSDVRIAYLYNDILKAIDDADFNRLANADYTLFGSMPEKALEKYSDVLNANIPKALRDKLTTNGDDLIYYLSRGREKFLFELDLVL
ncbi:hypothetical protein AALT52_01320 [Ligilactobacillus faecis]|uniref:AIPR protein n=1 Tax=Ligilactobacillus faecis TaxID=762833 RepID=A0ABV4DM36_9LACO